jgi:hypothetical protein
MDVDAHLVVGAIVKPEEILVVEHSVPTKCKACLPQHEAGQKFCGECGQRLRVAERQLWAPNVRAYFTASGRTMHSEDVYIDGSPPFENVSSVQSSEWREEPEWAVGVRVGRELSGEHRSSRAAPVSAATLEKAMAEVRETLAALGLPEREIQIFHVLYVSS